MFKKKSAFSLAEILVTLAIIGTVTALTIPPLKKYTEMSEFASGAKKAYSILSNITRMLEVEQGDKDRWLSTDPIAQWYVEKMNVAIDCGLSGSNCRKANTHTNPNGTSANPTTNGGGYRTVTTMDEITWQFQNSNDESCANLGLNSGSCTWIIFADINGGDKKPNMLGIDTFVFALSPTRGLIPAGNDVTSKCAESNGAACTSKVITKGKIDY